MQFITPRGDRRLNVRSEGPAIYDGNGRMIQPKSRRLYAEFGEGIPEPFWALAKQLFPYYADQTEKPIERYGGFYDSLIDQQQRGWTDEEREVIEQKLLQVGGDYVRVEVPKAPVPYASYPKQRKIHGRRTLDHVIEDISKAVVSERELKGEDLTPAIVAYERDHEDEHSAAIIAAVTALKEQEAEETLVAA